MSEPITRSCIDCGVTNCDTQDKTYPKFCLTTENTNDACLTAALYCSGSYYSRLLDAD